MTTVILQLNEHKLVEDFPTKDQAIKFIAACISSREKYIDVCSFRPPSETNPVKYINCESILTISLKIYKKGD